MAERRAVGRPRRGEAVRVTVCLRLDPDALRVIDEAAERRGETRSEYLERAGVERATERENPPTRR